MGFQVEANSLGAVLAFLGSRTHSSWKRDKRESKEQGAQQRLTGRGREAKMEKGHPSLGFQGQRGRRKTRWGVWPWRWVVAAGRRGGGGRACPRRQRQRPILHVPTPIRKCPRTFLPASQSAPVRPSRLLLPSDAHTKSKIICNFHLVKKCARRQKGHGENHILL